MAFVNELILFLFQTSPDISSCMKVVDDFCNFEEESRKVSGNAMEERGLLAGGVGVGAGLFSWVIACRAFEVNVVTQPFQCIGNS